MFEGVLEKKIKPSANAEKAGKREESFNHFDKIADDYTDQKIKETEEMRQMYIDAKEDRKAMMTERLLEQYKNQKREIESRKN